MRPSRDDGAAAIAEISRLTDQVVTARSSVASLTGRLQRAESDVKSAQTRMMAARVLVHDAQRETRLSAERCAWLESRCETLQEALDLAVHSTALSRWRWRRRMQQNQSSAHVTR